jgi:hypothetical protein
MQSLQLSSASSHPNIQTPSPNFLINEMILDVDVFPGDFYFLVCPKVHEIQMESTDGRNLHDFFDKTQFEEEIWFWNSIANPVEGTKRVQHFYPKPNSAAQPSPLERLSGELLQMIIDKLLDVQPWNYLFFKGRCRMWEHREGIKEAEGCCIERAIESDYIHNRMSKQITESYVRCSSQCTV